MAEQGFTEILPNYVTEDENKDLSQTSDTAAGSAGGPAAGGQVVGEVWLVDKRGRKYVGGRPPVYQQGDETIEEARARAGQKRKQDRPPRRSRTAKKPPAPEAAAQLADVEKLLIDALSSPAMVCAAFGDVWAADHFTRQAPVLARNLVVASQHNDWLRRKLEAAAQGGDLTMQLVTILGLAGSVVGYALPPLVWWFNLPVPDQARQLFGIPDRKQPPVNNAEPAPAAFPAAA